MADEHRHCATPPAATTWLSLTSAASDSDMRWLTPPPQRTANFSRARSPGVVLRVSRTLRLRALQGVRPRAGGGRDAGQAAQQVERAALGGEQVAGAGGDAQQLLPGLDPVAVLDVPLDLELVGADHRERPPRRSAGRRRRRPRGR